MEADNINDKLKQLYAAKFGAGSPCFLQRLREQRMSADEAIHPAYPLLIKIKDEVKYKSADLRIMIFGQETNSWETQVSNVKIPTEESHRYIDQTVDAFMEAYIIHKSKPDLKTPFWIAFKQLKKLTSEMKCELIWNNIYKIGNRAKNKNRPHEQIRMMENEYFDVIHEEISILKPDVLLFLTGPEYESRVTKKMKIADYHTISNIDKRKLARISVSNGILAYRTYHPGYLNRTAFFKDYLKLIVEDIKREKSLQDHQVKYQCL